MRIWEGLTSASSAKHAPNWGHFPCPPSLSLTISKQSSTIPNNCTDNSWRSPMLPKICSIFYAKQTSLQASLQLTEALIKHCTVDSDMTHLLWVPAGILAQAFSVNLQDTIGSVIAGAWPNRLQFWVEGQCRTYFKVICCFFFLNNYLNICWPREVVVSLSDYFLQRRDFSAFAAVWSEIILSTLSSRIIPPALCSCPHVHIVPFFSHIYSPLLRPYTILFFTSQVNIPLTRTSLGQRCFHLAGASYQPTPRSGGTGSIGQHYLRWYVYTYFIKEQTVPSKP